jgi:hypothetical protein
MSFALMIAVLPQKGQRVFAQICTLKCRGSLIIGMFLVVEAIEATGGPSLIDRVAPAEWLVERGAMLPVPI